MQGTLQEIDIREILQSIEMGQKTGELYIEAYPNRSNRETVPRSWLLFFVNGRIAYAVERSDESLARLPDYLYPDKIGNLADFKIDKDDIATSSLEYVVLWQLLAKKNISPSRARAILEAMIRETLFDLFGLRQGTFVFETGAAISPELLSLTLSALLPEIARQARQWQTFSPQIRQAEQFITLARTDELKAALPEKAYRNLVEWAGQKTTLRKLSRYLRRDMATIARNLYPYAQRGWLSLVSPDPDPVARHEWRTLPTEKTDTPHIVTIGRDETLGKKIGQLLPASHYRHTELKGSREALSSLFGIEPDALVCEIALEKLDGYELCRLLRGSSLFRSLPILLWAGNGEPIDPRRARKVGATDCLNEPLAGEEFLSSLARHLRVDRR